MKKKIGKIEKLTYLGSSVIYAGKAKKQPVIYTVTSIQEKGYKEPWDEKYMRKRCWGWYPTLGEAKVDPKDPHRFHGKWLACTKPKWAGDTAGWSLG